ncbi:SPASM domain-containing protein [bacterium]|nr:SPASM domain-containing protein [bacterium]
MVKKFIFNRLKNTRERFPRLLSIELSSICNANCIMCPHGELTRKKQNMPLPILEKIVNDCKGKPLKKANLFWFGDSLCNRQIIECLRIVRKGLPGVKLYLSTNAGLLTRDLSKSILDENLLDVINFDIDGIRKETFEGIRRKLDFDRVMENVHFFLDHKKANNYKKPQTRMTIIKMKPTENEIDAFVQYWTPLVDHVDVNKYNTWLGTKEDLNVGAGYEESRGGKFDFACIHPWDELVIAADGIAGLCCLDYDLQATIGDVTKQSIEAIWKSEVLNDYRSKMLTLDYDAIDVCRNCNAYIFQKNKTWAKLQR